VRGESRKAQVALAGITWQPAIQLDKSCTDFVYKVMQCEGERENKNIDCMPANS
jgi:hypothetical protein